MAIGIARGGGGSGGGGGLHFRNPVDEFVGASLAACRTSRDTYFSAGANAAALREFQGDQSLAIILNPTSATDNTFETYLPSTGTYDATQWRERTDAIEGNIGAQGRFEIIIHTSATSAPATPTGGSYNTAAGTLTPPTGWTEAPTVPGTSEDVYASQAVIDPETQSGTVTPVWSVPVERSHLSSGISHVETSADFTGTGIAGDVLSLANPVGISQVETSVDFTGAGITGDVLSLANPITPNPSDAPTAALLSIKYGSTTYNVDEIIDVTATGLPALTEANHRSLFIDFDTPRVWIGHRVHHASVDGTGTFNDYSRVTYVGTHSDLGAPLTSTVGQFYYNTSRHAWYGYGTYSTWEQTSLGTLISGGRWLGELQDDATAVNSVSGFSNSDTYLYYNATTGTVRVLVNSTYVAPQDPRASYQVEPISAPGGIVSAITGLTAGAGLAGGGTSGVVSVSVDATAADFPTIPVGKGGTGATDVAAARAALAVLNQAEVDARALARYSASEKTKLAGIAAGATAVSIDDVLDQILAGTGVTIDTSTLGQITLGAAGGGFTLLTGADAPASTLGADNDWYLRTSNGAMYQKGSGAWSLVYTDQVGQAGTGITESAANTLIQDALAAAVQSNTETGIIVTYNVDGTLDFVVSATPAQTHTNYVGIIDGALSAVTAADFTVSGVTGALVVPTYSGTRRMLFARPSAESDPTAVYLYQSGNRNTINQIGVFVKSGTTISLGGETHNWWGTTDTQSGLGGYILEQVN